ncbi:MAG: YbaK/EbsC family protein [archaeon]|jgi:prolyl-tRNA editing enzyme YbaK/EbsC (Cys-tRNA(Pro) deacylase)
MLADFLEVNNLTGKVISFPSDILVEKAAELNHISKSAIAKAFVFVDEKMNFFSVIAQKDESISVKDAVFLFKNKTLEEVSDKDVYRILGERKEYLSPVGVLGVNVALHDCIKDKKNLFFQIGERDFLFIQTSDILKAREFEEGFF